MKRPAELEADEASMAILVELTSAFEGIASMRIAQIKDQVMQSTKFFNELWGIYSQIKIGDGFGYGRVAGKNQATIIPKTLFIIITAEGGFSGDIDQKLVRLMLKEYDPQQHDIIVIGHHGALQLAQNKVSYSKYFKLPKKDKDINVTPISSETKRYKATKVFYQEYISLMEQDVKSIELSTALIDRGSDDNDKDVINEQTYIFEPSTMEVVAHLENSMVQIVISQLILESKLAQYASRFRAMSIAHERADDMKKETHLNFNRARRYIKDERLKEVINGIKKSNVVGRI
ncbi:MAG TPA: F0F1 ATP synthase subunit gamma [Candidatus Saccharimonadales bacterium]|nr:F0F1 ATP synthase subunit gamma [Candidatus Saccharimonadales bacterium]